MAAAGEACSSGRCPLEAVKPLRLPGPGSHNPVKRKWGMGNTKNETYFLLTLNLNTSWEQRGTSAPAGQWEQQDLLWVASSAHQQLETRGGDGWGGWSEKWEATAGWREATPLWQAQSKQWAAKFNGSLLKLIVLFEHHSLEPGKLQQSTERMPSMRGI